MLPIMPSLNAEETAFMARSWYERAEREAHLQLRFDSLFQALRAHQATKTVITLAQQTAQDCAKHSETYLSIAKEFGSELELPETRRMGPLAPTSLSITERILFEMAALSCVEETLTGCLMGQIYRQAKYPRVRLTAHLSFQDEIWHSRLGWAHLGNVSKQHSISWLSPLVPQLLNLAQRHELFAPEHPLDSRHHLVAYGHLPFQTRRTVLREGIQTIILPGLESMGVDIESGRQWANQHL